VRLVVVLAAAVIAASAPAAACGGHGDSGSGYTSERRDAFVQACANGAGADVCRCYWDRLAATVPYDRFVALDRQIRKDPAAVPDDIAALAAACGVTAGR
jgi:hypothetical protein